MSDRLESFAWGLIDEPGAFVTGREAALIRVLLWRLCPDWRRDSRLRVLGDELARLDAVFERFRLASGRWHDAQQPTPANGSAEENGSGEQASSPPWLTARQLAEQLGCSVEWARTLARESARGSGPLVAERVGRQWLIDPASVVRLRERGSK